MSAHETSILAELNATKDPEIFGIFFREYFPQIVRFVYRRVPSEEAEDLAAEVFARAWKYLVEKQRITHMRGLLHKIARNLIVEFYRTRSNSAALAVTEVQLEIEGLDSAEKKSITEEFEQKELVAQVQMFLPRIKAEYKEILTLRFIDELEIYEIAEALEISQVNVRVTIHRAVKALRKIIATTARDTNAT